jgi:hypothetical protein
MKRMFLILSILPMGLLGCYLTVISVTGICMAMRNYDPNMARFFAAFGSGVIFGAGSVIVISQYKQRLGIRFRRFSLRDVFVVMTGVALFLGLISYVLNKT